MKVYLSICMAVVIFGTPWIGVAGAQESELSKIVFFVA